MPYKSEKLKLPPTKDRRRKLTDEQKEEIRLIYAEGKVGMRPLAKKFGVSRSLIQIIVNPDIAERKRQYVKDHWRDYRPSKEEWAETMKEHRHYKHELYLKGELNNEN
jgi:DNA invertase Pin-like site-specific DNA recombinase